MIDSSCLKISLARCSKPTTCPLQSLVMIKNQRFWPSFNLRTKSFTVNKDVMIRIYGFWKTRNDGIFRGTFLGTFSKNFRSGSKWSKYTYVRVIAYSELYFSRYEIFWKTRNFRRNSADFFQKS